jgi:hypothetical protein
VSRLTQTQKIIVLSLFAVFSAQVFFLIQDKSPTTDEVSFHNVNGYVYLKTRDYRMSPSTPALVRQWMALPWLFLSPQLDLDHPSWDEADTVPFAVHFFYKVNRGISDLLLYTSRFMVYILALLLGVSIYRWSKKLYGNGAALFSLGLFVFSPTVVAHSALATVDVGIALFYFLTFFFLYEDLENQKKTFSWKAAVCFGLALATKYTAILLLPIIFFLLPIKQGVPKGLWHFIKFCLLAFLVVWASYSFETKPFLENVPRAEEKIGFMVDALARFSSQDRQILEELVKVTVFTTPMPMPTWILGLLGIFKGHLSEYSHYFMGKWTQEGIWYHYLVSFGIKVTLAFLVAMMLRAFFFWRKGSHLRKADAYLFLPVLVLVGISFFDSTGVGIRYFLPLFPFLFVWLGALWLQRPKAIAAVLLVSHAGLALIQFPNYIPYFNALAGGPHGGYRVVRGSDVDWGQEVKNLGKYTKEKGITRIKTYLFGTRDEDFYEIPHVDVSKSERQIPRNEIYAISAFHVDRFKWTSQTEPTDRIGNAIFIYDLRKP